MLNVAYVQSSSQFSAACWMWHMCRARASSVQHAEFDMRKARASSVQHAECGICAELKPVQCRMLNVAYVQSLSQFSAA